MNKYSIRVVKEYFKNTYKALLTDQNVADMIESGRIIVNCIRIYDANYLRKMLDRISMYKYYTPVSGLKDYIVFDT